MSPLTVALALFPSLEHQQIGVGPYNHVVDEAPIPLTPALPLHRLNGLDLTYRGFEWRDEFDSALRSNTGRLRLYVDGQGVVHLDQLLLDSPGASIRVRRELGDYFDLGLLGGNFENTWDAEDLGWVQYRIFSPSHLTLLGFSNTDQDNDDKLKHYISIGSGAGVDAIGRIVGPVGLRLRGVGEARTLNRHQGGTENHVRHEVNLSAEAGLAVLFESQAWMLNSWAEMTTQWETRDADGKSGVDRQHLAWGLRLDVRLYRPDNRDLSDPLGAVPSN